MAYFYGQRKPTFLWQALLILLPVGLLAAVGFIFLRQDKLVAEAGAAQRAQGIADQLLSKLERELFPSLESRLLDPAAFQVGRNGDLLFPAPLAAAPEPLSLEPAKLNDEQRALWTTLQSKIDREEIIKAAKQFLELNPPTNYAGAAWYAYGLCQNARGNASAAAYAFREIRLHYPSAIGETGIPLRPLAELQLITMAEPSQARTNRTVPSVDRTDEVDPTWASFCASVLTSPSLLTGYLLDRAISLAPSGEARETCQLCKEQWIQWELLRRIHASMWEPGETGHWATNMMAVDGEPGSNSPLAYSAALNRMPLVTWVSLPEPWPVAGSAFVPTSTNTTVAVPVAIEEQNWLVTRLDGSADALRRFLADFPAKEMIFQSAGRTGRFARVELDLKKPTIPLGFGNVAAIFLCRPEYEIGSNVTALVESVGSIPDYFGVGVEIAGRQLSRFAPDLHTWQRVAYAGKGGGLRKEVAHERATKILASAASLDRGGLRVSIYLTSPSRLFERQATRTFWFGSLIGVSGLAALLGLVTAWRVFLRQQALNDMKSNFVSSVSHELRAPIASVRLLAESLDRGKVTEPDRQREYFRFIVQECRRLSGLIENVLDFSRIDQGRKRYEFEPTDLLGLVRQTQVTMEPYAADHGVRLAVALPQSTGQAAEQQPVMAGKAIQQALINLVDNAIKHSPKDSTVTIGVEYNSVPKGNAAEPTIGLWVEDHGEGIPAQEHEKIFERFYRCGSELRRETPGVGIGLSIVKYIVEAHQGRVHVRSAPGQGSRFTIELPNNPLPEGSAGRSAFWKRPATGSGRSDQGR